MTKSRLVAFSAVAKSRRNAVKIKQGGKDKSKITDVYARSLGVDTRKNDDQLKMESLVETLQGPQRTRGEKRVAEARSSATATCAWVVKCWATRAGNWPIERD